MTFQPTTTQTLKSFAGAAIFGLSMDAASLVSHHMSDADLVRVARGWPACCSGVFRPAGSPRTPRTSGTACSSWLPAGLAAYLGSLAHLLGSAV